MMLGCDDVDVLFAKLFCHVQCSAHITRELVLCKDDWI